MIDGNSFGLIELIASFSIILGVLGWQWFSIRKTLREDRAKSAKESANSREVREE